MTANLAASVHARLVALAKQRGQEAQLVLTRYGVERFLYRLSRTAARDALCLKGALLFDLWFNTPQRPTRDADFLGAGPGDAEALAAMIVEACAVETDDGMVFDPSTVRVREIREEARHAGLRVTLEGTLGRARCPVQIDVGYGDAVTPGPEEAVYPTLLPDLPAPRLRVYPRETVVAEKLEAIVSLGMTNSRMKDYYDLRMLAREGAVDPGVLATAIAATFARRGTAMSSDLPMGLTDDFANDGLKQTQWGTFLSKNRLEAPPLDVVVREVREFLAAPLVRASGTQA